MYRLAILLEKWKQSRQWYGRKQNIVDEKFTKIKYWEDENKERWNVLEL